MIQTNKAVLAVTFGEFKSIGEKNVFKDEMRKRALEVGFNPGDSERTSWGENYEALKILFNKSNLPDDIVIAFEYRAPVGGRVDCMLFGKGKDGKNNVVLFELKGWRDAKLSYNNTLIETFTGGRLQDVDHPSEQAERYYLHFTNYIELLCSDDYHLTSIAYCYNYVRSEKNNALYHKSFDEVMSNHPLFNSEDRDRLADLLSNLLGCGSGKEIYVAISSCHEKPTEKLISAAADLVVDKDRFYLLGDQNVAFKKFNSILIDTLNNDGKSVIVIKGGPGTGKTVLALKMLSQVAKMSKTPVFTTRSTALRDELRRALTGLRVKDLIRDIYDFRPYNYCENEIDVLIVDEAHRVPESANTYRDKGKYYNGDGDGYEVYNPLSQITSLIYCSKVTVFFIDDKQATKSRELGESQKIARIAENYSQQILSEIEAFKVGRNGYRSVCLNYVNSTYKNKLIVKTLPLETQFRCIGGAKFVAWLDEVLYKNAENVKLKLTKSDLGNYDFRIFNDPSKLYDLIKSLNVPAKKQTARLCAGWCWPWGVETDGNGDLKKEVDLMPFGYSFAMPWETQKGIKGLRKEYKGGRYAPDTNSWPSHPMGVNQIGCIYTAQGFEFDYVGVIIGPDLIYDVKTDCLKCVRERNEEREMTDITANVLIRNIYRVLMSRGKYGCYIYCCDPKVSDYFKRFMID